MTELVRRNKRSPRIGDTQRTEYLAFRLAGDVYGVRISMVAEILRPPPITEVPRAPRSVIGVVSVRGRLVTIVDARRRLGLAESSVDGRTRILLVDVKTDELVGLLVDEVLQVYRLGEDEIEAASVLGGDQPPHILGIGRPEALRDAAGHTASNSSIVVLIDVTTLIHADR
jgi:purine-binding chemotaxis protein CheW